MSEKSELERESTATDFASMQSVNDSLRSRRYASQLRCSVLSTFQRKVWGAFSNFCSPWRGEGYEKFENAPHTACVKKLAAAGSGRTKRIAYPFCFGEVLSHPPRNLSTLGRG